MSELSDMVAAAQARKRQGQGMRQPQMGGIQSQLYLADARPLCAAKHGTWWRLKTGGPWVCVVCHPSPFPHEKIEVGDRFAVRVDRP